MVGVPVPALVTLQVALAGGDTYIAELIAAGVKGQPCSPAAYNALSMMGRYAPSTIVLALSLAAWFLRKRISATRLPRPYNCVPYISLTLALIATVLYSSIPPLNNAYQLPRWALYLLV